MPVTPAETNERMDMLQHAGAMRCGAARYNSCLFLRYSTFPNLAAEGPPGPLRHGKADRGQPIYIPERGDSAHWPLSGQADASSKSRRQAA